ncbi:alpha/beta fold hydrolase [Lewinella sp. 4G2]|uniref:alpha/beta fold hydrolase n=1 Tax=Lewinella sp. 4G2 TaxID=1803372 RepID=UPI0007B489CB|nr:alpha/beta hydrolase [Lewinella sp. 4G2]OAV45991.1 hypothetical protein A3850_019040 [Lewinella sp. 4G2]
MNTRKLLFKGLGLGLNLLSYVSPQKTGDLTFKIFATPPPPNVREKERKFLTTAERQDFKHEGKNVAVYSWGPADGPIVICSYGWGYNAGRWRHYVPTLVEAGMRVVAFDPVGHGLADKGVLHFPRMVNIIQQLIRQTGGCEMALVHSFGGGCLIEALAGLPKGLHPKRMCVLATFSTVRWIFLTFTQSLGLRDIVFEKLEAYVYTIAGRHLNDYDVAASAAQLGHVEALLIHDPADSVTAFMNSERNHSHWPGSALYRAEGAGHHLGTAGVTRIVLEYLVNGTLPDPVSINKGDVEPIPAVMTLEDLSTTGGVSDYYQ